MDKLLTDHGTINFPAFMPVATRGAIKNVSPDELKNIGAEILLANTYHLMQRPGIEIIKKAGGLHKFMNWHKPILTDSGGFQVFSLAKFRKLQGDGVEFMSEIDGKKYFLTPKKVIQMQKDLGVDIAMMLDVCTPYPCSYKEAKEAVRLTIKWATNSKLLTPNLKIFAIIQGSTYKDLREECAKQLVKLDFDGYAIGGMAGEKLNQVLNWTCPLLPKNKPIYLMGIGRPKNIKYAVKLGVDMFDCVAPAREARHGRVYITNTKTINLLNQKYQKDFKPISKNCDCPACQNYSRAYLRHLLSIGEGLGMRLATLHNLNFILQFVLQIVKKEGFSMPILL